MVVFKQEKSRLKNSGPNMKNPIGLQIDAKLYKSVIIYIIIYFTITS